MRWIADIQQDGRYAVRTLRASPGFAMVAVLSLALGIGATTAIYSVVDAILLKPLPFADSGRLVRVVENLSFVAGRPPIQGGISHEQYLEWRTRTVTLTDTMAFSPGLILVRTGEGTARLWGAMVSAHTFTTLQARAMLGRTLDPGDEAQPDVIVLGFDTWRRLFHSNPSVVGTAIELERAGPLDRRRLTVVGVMPAGFGFPTTGMDYYTPIVPDGTTRRWPGVTLIGRLGPGVSMNAAMEEAGVIGAAIRPPRAASLPPLTVPRFEVQGLKDQIVKDLRPALRVLLAVVVVVLLIVCANVANLLLARGTARQREMAVRLAVGATRGRVARQVLTECLVLATVGGTLGAAIAVAGVALVKALALVEAPGIFRLGLGTSILPRGSEVSIDLGMFALAFGVAAATSLLFGVLPALHMSRTNHLHATGPRGGGSRQGESRLRAALVVGQLVLATVLLVGAGLLIRSYFKLWGIERGYDPANVLAFQLGFPPEYSVSRKQDTIEALLAKLRATPAVESAGFTRAGMLIGEQITVGTFVPPGRTPDEMRAYPMAPSLRPVSPGYLTATGARLLDGHDLPLAEGTRSTPAIVISRTVARRFAGEGSPVGQLIDWHMGDHPVQLQVVGVVEDLRNTSPEREPYPEVFIDYRQLLPLLARRGDSPPRQDQTAIGLLSFAVRTRGDPAAAVPVVGRIIRSVDPQAGIDAILPLDRLVASSVGRQRFSAVLLGVFAGVAGLLAAIGIYGVLAYAVVQRTREIGIRMALGARRAQVLAGVLRQGLLLAGTGIALGLAVAAAGTRTLQSLLFGVTPLDPWTYAVVATAFGFVAACAAVVPARRAATVDPMVALRND
jgi:putative ABC transport system permease protein